MSLLRSCRRDWAPWWTRRLAVAIVLGVLGVLGAATAVAAEPPAPSADQAVVAVAIRGLIDATAPVPLDPRPLDMKLLRRFYAGRDFAPAWPAGSTDGPTGAAAMLVSAIGRAAEDGLEPASYHLAAIGARAQAADAATRAERDLLLTDAFFAFAHDLRLGRAAPEETGSDIAFPPQRLDPVPLLAAALATDGLPTLLASLPSPQPGYRRLRAALARYRAIKARGGWPLIATTRATRLTDGDPILPVLARRLAAEGVMPDAGGDKIPSAAAIEGALRRFQERNGVAPTGRLDAPTLDALNVTAAEKAERIRLNLERWRWLPARFERRVVLVNVAAAALDAIEDDRVVLHSRMVVGDPRHHTPMLRTEAVAATVNPPWNVPTSIIRHEILPKIARDPGYLAHHDMIVLSNSPLRIRQLPGAQNALGLVKVEMPNRFDVYLHDTPQRALFARARRFFSHGCMRVERAKALAAFVLGAPWDVAAVTAAIAEGATRTIDAAARVPVYVLYWTAFVDPDGTVQFRDDVYGRDADLAMALAAHRPAIASREHSAVGCST